MKDTYMITVTFIIYDITQSFYIDEVDLIHDSKVISTIVTTPTVLVLIGLNNVKPSPNKTRVMIGPKRCDRSKKHKHSSKL